MAEDEEDNEEDDEDDSDTESEGEDIEIVWVRTENGTWVRYWREAHDPLSWKPGAADPAPEPLTEPVQAIQALWRGHTVRSEMAVAGALLSLKNAK
jgi:hypothetical protein